MQVQIRNVRGHYEVYAADGSFLFSADTHREVMEEVGLRVKNLRFYKSQPWSFSDTLLMGFYCDLDGEDRITLDRDELAVAEWFNRGQIPAPELDISLTSEMMMRFQNGECC